MNDAQDKSPLSDDERDLLIRLAQSPLLIARTGPLGRRFLLEDFKQRGLVTSAPYQRDGIIYSITQAGLKAISDR